MRPRSSLANSRRRIPLTEQVTHPRKHRPDYWLLILTLILLSIGLVVLYAISPGLAVNSSVGQNYYINRQMLAVLLGLIGFLITANMPIEWWRKLERPLIVIAALSAIAVRLAGQQVNGAYRWIQVGGFSFQSNELIKFTILIWLASFLTQHIKNGTLAEKSVMKPFLIAFALVGFVVAGIQSDLGSAGVLIVMMATMAFVSGVPLKRIGLIIGVIAVAFILAVSTSGYRRQRLLTFLHPTSNCQTTGYQSCQALIGVGTGGLTGLGLGRSVQAYGYLPEAADDSIFAIYSEKFGLIGSLVLFGIFIALFSRIKRVIEHAPDNFSRLLVTGILAWLSSQALINIGAMIGILPLEGITLPFISYGGTSIMFVTAAMGIVFQISRYTTYGTPMLNKTGEGNHDYSGNRSGVRRAYNANSGSRARA